MFLNNSNQNKNIPPEGERQNKLIYLNSNIPEDEDEIDLSELLNVFRRRGLIIIGTTITLATILSTWILMKPRVYQGTFSLLVEPLNIDNSQLSFLSDFSDAAAGFKNSQSLDYNSQINVLESPLVMEPIISEIKSLYPDTTRDDFMKQGSKKLSLNQLEETKIIEVSYKDESEKKILAVLDKLVKGYLKYQEQDYFTSLSQAQYFTQDQIDRVREDVSLLASQLETFQKVNNLIDPDSQNEIVVKQTQFLLEQKEEIQAELNSMIKLAQELESQLNLTPEQAVIVSRLNQDGNYAKLISQIKDLETQIALESIKWDSQHPTIETLKEQKQELVSLLNQQTTEVLGDKASKLSLEFITSMPNNVDIIQKFFDTNNEIQVLKTKEASINKALTQMNQNINVLSTKNKKYYEIQRDFKTANESLNRLLELHENLQIEVAKQSSPWRLLTPIDESIIEDISGRGKKIALISIASLFCGILLGFLIDKLDSKLHSFEELEKTINLPLLGSIPYSKNIQLLSEKALSKTSIDSYFKKKSPKQNKTDVNLDSYISLYTNINYLSSDTHIRSLVIGAAEPSEGKSTTSLYLAKAAATLGKKVLLVDLDLRKPKMHSYLGLKNRIGISDLIVEDLELNKVIQETNEENLFVITTGTKVPNPTTILSSQKMKDLMSKLKHNFDFVIYDTPPLSGFSDAKMLTPFTDGLVFIIGLGKTHRPNVQRVINDLKVSNINVLGMVANGLKKSMTGYYGYGYYNYKQYYQEEA